jgi:ATP-binding cassette subfamily F protein uup
MAPISLTSAIRLTKELGGRTLFSDLSLVVHEQERVILIGPNGSGKSTLLKILAGITDADAGEVRARRDLRLAYVTQQDHFDGDHTVTQILEHALAAAHIDPDDIPRRISVTLGNCGFDDGEAQVSTLSGGWKKRLALARAFASEPELLLLDEPTNHLDIDGIRWLEEYLLKLRCAVVLVSHDRWFIERLANRIVEIDKRYPTGTFESSGGYGDFIENRAAFLEGLTQMQSSLANKVRREVEWLRQGVKARTTKSRARIDAAHRMITDLKGMKLDADRASLEFSASKRKTKELIKLEEVGVVIEGKTLFDGISLTLSPGTRLGVVGPNGSGKSTFVRTLLGQRSPDSGRVTTAPLLKTALFDQARKELPPGLTLKEALCPHGDSVVFQGQSLHVASWAARFMFSPNQLSLPVTSLSGGEHARALLARLMLNDADVLLFDEPTNDLDIPTLEVLEDAFVNFPGAIVLVTHDRYFLDRTSTMVLGISPVGGGVFADYAQWEDSRSAASETGSSYTAERGASTPRQPSPSKAKTKLTYQEQRELGGIEKAILDAEEKVGSLEAQVSSPENASNSTKLTELCTALALAKSEVERLYGRWEELEEKKRALELS